MMQQKQSYDILDLIELFMEIRKVQLQENGWWLEELRQEKEIDIKVETGKQNNIQ